MVNRQVLLRIRIHQDPNPTLIWVEDAFITNDPDRLGTAIDSDQRRKRPFLSSQFRDIFTVLHNDLLLQEIQIRIPFHTNPDPA